MMLLLLVLVDLLSMENLRRLYRLCNQRAARRACSSSQLHVIFCGVDLFPFTWEFIASLGLYLTVQLKKSSEEAEGRRSKMQMIFVKSRSRSEGNCEFIHRCRFYARRWMVYNHIFYKPLLRDATIESNCYCKSVWVFI
jgi:hypothetical protein